jgi:hypothetical protein
LARRPNGNAPFKFFLVEHDQVVDPAGFVTAVPNWTIGETFMVAFGEEFRILEIHTEIANEYLDASFNGIFVVEPA